VLEPQDRDGAYPLENNCRIRCRLTATGSSIAAKFGKRQGTSPENDRHGGYPTFSQEHTVIRKSLIIQGTK
jgi:hypothetical protein